MAQIQNPNRIVQTKFAVPSHAPAFKTKPRTAPYMYSCFPPHLFLCKRAPFTRRLEPQEDIRNCLPGRERERVVCPCALRQSPPARVDGGAREQWVDVLCEMGGEGASFQSCRTLWTVRERAYITLYWAVINRKRLHMRADPKS